MFDTSRRNHEEEKQFYIQFRIRDQAFAVTVKSVVFTVWSNCDMSTMAKYQ